MAQTKAALIQEVVAELSALGSGQSASADDIAFVEARVAPIVDELSKGRVITIANIEAIPDYAFPDLVRIVAEECAPKFLRPTDKAKLDAARASLTRLTRLDRSASPFVLAVLEQLDAFGASSPTLDATAVAGRIPAFIAELAARNVIYVADMDEIESSGGDKHPGFNDFAKYVAANLASPPLYPVIQFAEGRLRQLAPVGTYPTLAVDYF
jgi:hypothetical protein